LGKARPGALGSAGVAFEYTAARPVLQRFWGTACRRDETVYLILFINDRCLVLAPS